MKYKVFRTSSRCSDDPPCPGAVKETYITVDRRTCSLEKVHEQFWGANWFATGTNHREEPYPVNDSYMDKGQPFACRDLEAEGWFVEIPDLHEFVQKNGEIILNVEDNIWCVEIYDDDRE